VVRTVKKEPINDKAPLEIKTDKQQIAVSDVKINKEEKAKKSLKIDTLSSGVVTHVVQKGDNLSSIAKKNNVTVAEIKEWNHLVDNSIQLGASLQVAKNDDIANKEESTQTPKLRNLEYIVKKGDNLSTIAKKFGASIENLKLWNNLPDINVALGSPLIVAKNEIVIVDKTVANSFSKKENLASVSKKNEINYYVKKGDSLYSISKKYPGVTISDIKKWNNINAEDLKPGMKLKING
jgi:membrane-bound lytic murein transglycosylase D